MIKRLNQRENHRGKGFSEECFCIFYNLDKKGHHINLSLFGNLNQQFYGIGDFLLCF